MKKTVKPGQTIDVSGQYMIKNTNGKLSKTEITLVSGKKTPPTPKPGQKMVLTDKTKHKK